MKEERWLPVVGYEGLYEVSSLGRIKSLGNGNSNLSKEKIMKLRKTKDGYLCIDLCKNGESKNFRVHRLVAIAFIPNPDNLPCVNHKNENKLDNCVDNLEWCTHKYNINYGTRNDKVSKALKNRHDLSKSIICVETGEIYPSVGDASRKNKISRHNISSCLTGKRNMAGGLHWVYA